MRHFDIRIAFEMAENGAAVASGSFVPGGFQMKGSSKRRKITSESGAEIEVRETVLGIEKGIIKAVVSSLSEASSQLIIPLPPPRIDAPKKQTSVVEIEMEKISDQPMSLEQQAAEELIAEMTGTTKKAAVNLLSIPIASSDPSGKRKETYGRSAPLLAASLAPELIGLRDDDERFKADINTRPEDLNVRSDAYKVVRIEDFGAAMLRGMGWSGEKEEVKEEEKLVARDARLGLGASARPPDEKQRGSKEDIKKRKEEWDKKASEKLKKQLLNDGDMVWLRDVANAGKRALVVCTRGVPGLDRIRVRLELSGKSIEIKRTDAVLLSEDDLKAEPYRPVDPVNADIVTNQFFGLKNDVEDSKESGGGRKDRSERDRKETRDERDTRERGRDSERERDRVEGERGRDRGRDREHDRNRNNEEGNSKRSNSNGNNEDERRNTSSDNSKNHPDGNKDYKNKNDHGDNKNNISSIEQDTSDGKGGRGVVNRNGDSNGNSSNDKRSNDNNSSSSSSKNSNSNSNSNNSSGNSSSNKSNSSSSSTWLVTGIRVRVVSKRCAGHLEKGSVVDVPSARLATVRLDGGKVIEGIKEEYLETVLPPIGGRCTVLSGTYRGQSAILIEKRKEEGLAFIQLEDDLEGVLLSMDHIASRM